MMGRGLLWLAAGIPGAEEKRGYLWIFIDTLGPLYQSPSDPCQQSPVCATASRVGNATPFLENITFMIQGNKQRGRSLSE